MSNTVTTNPIKIIMVHRDVNNNRQVTIGLDIETILIKHANTSHNKEGSINNWDTLHRGKFQRAHIISHIKMKKTRMRNNKYETCRSTQTEPAQVS